ncbi:nonsense-mediated mRNA decay protein 3 [Methanococcus voltae]|uniref:60S ribosomal export protein NMD3 n=1 Tax=Methanococcus voltae TaxID=2188 RepID=UPI001AE207AA|nr:60S ribosomal export protein NMD3 [Methanococcus voltae]MBP2143328.1 nonsense-mediated mRNA decay protein 3 [Methanococcus voltae]
MSNNDKITIDSGSNNAKGSFCYRCGHEGELLDGLCNLCYSQLNPLFTIDDRLTIEVCHMCGSYKRKLWCDPKSEDTYAIMDEIAYFAVKDNLKKSNKSIDVQIIPKEAKQLPGGKHSRVEIPVTIIAEGRLIGEKRDRTEEKEVVVYLTMVQCPRCSRCMSNYYEGTLQVRAMGRFLSEEERVELDDFVREEVSRRLKKDRMAFISKFIIQKEGLDYQMGSMGAIRNIASAIKTKYGGKSLETAKLVGVDKDTGKDQYRITVSIRIPQYAIGDVIAYNETICVVTAISEDKTHLKILDNSEKISLNWNDVEKNTYLVCKSSECQTATVISVADDTIMAMDDITYEVYEYNNDVKTKEGSKVKIFKNEELNRIIDLT